MRRLQPGLPLAGVLLVLLGVPAGLALLTGSLSIPHNDAWAHGLIAQQYARTGRLELVGWNRPALLGQVVLLGPLGASVLGQQLAVLLLAVLGLAAGYGFLAPRTGPRRALFAVAVLAAVPDFGLLATSFMTDLPAFAGIAGCLWLADRAAGRSPLLLVAATAAGGWAATVREQAVAAPLAVLLVALLRARGRDRALPAGLLALLLAGLTGLERWRRTLPGDDPPHPQPSWALLPPGLAGGLLVLALYLLPALLLVARPARWPVRAWLVAAGLAVPAGIVGWGCDPLLANTLSRHGPYASASLGPRAVLPEGVWTALLLAAVLAVALLAGHVTAGGLRLRGAAALFSWLTGAGLLVQLATGQGLFSRYLLPLLLPLLAGLLARPPGGVPARPAAASGPARGLGSPNHLVAAAGLAGMLALSWPLTATTLAYDAARWQAASELVRRGVPATDIDAGLEWVGTHAGVPARLGATNPYAVSWYGRMFTGARACYLVKPGRRPAGELAARPEFRRYAVTGRERLWVVRTGRCERPRAAPTPFRARRAGTGPGRTALG